MKAIILAAGRGSRLSTVSDGRPKCLVEVGGMSILERQLRSLEAIGVSRFTIVVGYMADVVKAAAKSIVGHKAEFVENPNFASTNTSVSLWIALQNSPESFYYLNGDVIAASGVYERLANPVGPSTLALDLKECRAEEVKVILDGDRIVRIGKALDPTTTAGEFIGIAWFNRLMAQDLNDSLQSLIFKENRPMAYFEEALDPILMNNNVVGVDISSHATVEIDFPEDLVLARRIALEGRLSDGGMTIQAILSDVA